VLVHASVTDHRIWAPHARRIGQHFRVIAPTQRFFGSTPWPDDGRVFSIATHAVDLAEFIRALEIEPVSMVGWSYGAAVCLMMAATRPELVRRLVLYEPAISSFVNAPADAQAASADRVVMTAPARAQISLGDPVTAVPLFMDGVNDQSGAFTGLLPRVQQIMFDNSHTLPLLFDAPVPALGCHELEPLEQTSVVVAHGDATRTFYRISAEWTAMCAPGSTLVRVSGARHLFPVEDDTRFADLILQLVGTSRDASE
jgi:pimeloyl-ACP methyl ester carboxylesterase